MNILHINNNYAETKLHRHLIHYLDKKQITNDVFVPVFNEELKKNADKENVYIEKCFNQIDRFIFDYKQKKIYDVIEKKCNIKKYELMHAYTLFTDGNLAMKLSKKYNIPYVVAVRDTDVNVFFKKRFYLRKRGIEIMKNASAIFFLSKPYLDELNNKYIPKEDSEEIIKKSYIVPNGIDDFWIQNTFYNKDVAKTKERLKNKNLKILYVGRIEKRKNIDLILKAISHMQSEDWNIEFNAIGRNTDNALLNKLKKDKNFIYLGPKPKEELINYYRNSDIYVMPSKTETFGLVYAEAMSQGLPVIYTKGQGFDGQFEEGQVGYHVDCKDYKDLIIQIKKIVEKYEKIEENCVKYSDKFKWEDIGKFYYKLYTDILQKEK